MNDLAFLLEILVVSSGGALVKILFTTEPIPISRQLRIFIGSLILSSLVGYMISASNFQRFWYIGSILLSAVLGETVVKVIREETPSIVTSVLKKYFNIKTKDENDV